MAKPTKLQIAWRLRKAAEKAAKKVTYGGCPRGDLQGWCAIMSWLLRKHFRAAGYSADLVYGHYKFESDPHCWVASEDTIYDLTLTQFENCKPVMVIRKGHKWFERFVPVKRVHHFAFFMGWPSDQKPTVTNLEAIQEFLV